MNTVIRTTSLYILALAVLAFVVWDLNRDTQLQNDTEPYDANKQRILLTPTSSPEKIGELVPTVTQTPLTMRQIYTNANFGYQFEYSDDYVVVVLDDESVESWINSATTTNALKEAVLFHYEVVGRYGDVIVFNKTNPAIAFVISLCPQKRLSECVEDSKKRYPHDTAQIQNIGLGNSKSSGVELSTTLDRTVNGERTFNKRIDSLFSNERDIFELDFVFAPDRYPLASQIYYVDSYYNLRNSFSFQRTH